MNAIIRPADIGPATAPAARLPPSFCGAPWLESVVRINGDVFPCARIEERWGNVEEQALSDIWRSPVAREFRKSIREGRPPSPTCVKCYRDRTTTTLRRLFDAAVSGLWISYESACQAAGLRLGDQLCGAMPPFHAAIRQEPGPGSLRACRQLIIEIFRARHRPYPPAARAALRKLRVIAWASIDFMRGRLVPRCLGTHRQVNLVAVCNARCIYCIGLFNREIIDGEPIDGQRFKRMPTDHVPRAFERSEAITSFFMNGSEFFLYPDWRGLVAEFARLAVRLKLSTNAMLLTPEASEFLIESQVLQDFNISLDGALPETIERVRPMVKFDVVMRHIEALFATIDRTRTDVPTSVSMILMRDTMHEAPGLVALADRMRAGRAVPIHVNFQGLNPSRQAGYAEFYDGARVELAEPAAMAALREAAELGRKLGIGTFYGYNGTLDEALDTAAARPLGDVPILG